MVVTPFLWPLSRSYTIFMATLPTSTTQPNLTLRGGATRLIRQTGMYGKPTYGKLAYGKLV